MKLQKLSCPNCNGLLNMELVKESDYIFCPYCGEHFYIKNDKKEHTLNKNISLNKNIYHVKRKIDDTEIEKAKASAKEIKYILFFVMIMLILMFGPSEINSFKEKIDAKKEAKKEEQAGKINIGSHYDYEEENYEFVVAEMQALGFKDIELIDLDDAGFFKNNANTVKSISVNGNSKFTNQNYFYITDKVIITYH